MSYSKAVFDEADRAMELRRHRNKEIYERRKNEIYGLYPRIAEIDIEMKKQSLAIIGDVINKNADVKENLKKLREANINLQVEKAELLVAAGKPIDYLDEIFTCKKCHDTGIYKGLMCTCYENELKKAAFNLSSLGSSLKDQTFENFDLNYYDKTKSINGLSYYSNMKRIKEECIKFAENFGSNNKNLLFTGGTGLGKTHLSSAIAQTVINKGFGVLYVTSPELFERFESEKFNRNTYVERYVDINTFFEEDLLIIDDLGSEFTTPFVEATLFSIINGRNIKGKSTIINTNCSLEQLENIYSKKIVSRILGEYLILFFTGEDIRVKKRKKSAAKSSQT